MRGRPCTFRRAWAVVACLLPCTLGDLMVLRVFEHDILQRRAKVSDFEYCAMPADAGTLAEPKYAGETDQIDTTNVIPPGPGTCCETGS